MTDSTKKNSSLLVILSVAILVGILGGVAGYYYAINSYSTSVQSFELEMAGAVDELKSVEGKLKTAQDRLKTTQVKLNFAQELVKAAEMTTDVAVALAVGHDSSAANCTLDEAMDLVERLTRLGERNEIIQSKFSQRVIALKKEFLNDLNPPVPEGKPMPETRPDLLPRNTDSWREMANYWKSKYLNGKNPSAKN